MNFGHLFECGMLVCFGFSWPLNVIKAYKARTAKGTSLAFIILIITGYLAGITAKFLNHQLNYVLAVYFLNLVIVLSNVIVYLRNVTLDRKAEGVRTKKKIYELQQKFKNSNYIKEEHMNFKELNTIANKNQVVLLGGSLETEIPVTELAQSFEFNFDLYNRSAKNLSLKEAKAYFEENVAALKPEGIIIHLGEKDISFFQNNATAFDKAYLDVIAAVKKANKKCRIALVSVANPKGDSVISNMNTHIKAIAASARAVYINLDNVKLWNPEATKAASAFARNMGLSIRKPLNDVAEILYSYAYLEMQYTEVADVIAG
jgi:hypothetical protein